MAKKIEPKKKPQQKKPGKKVKAPVDPNAAALSKLYGAEGYNAGQAFVNQYMPQGFLGGVDTGGDASTAIGKEMADIRSRYQAGLGGYTAPEYQAQREQMQRGVNSNLQTSLGQLAKAQARGKVYGAAASAQQANTLRGAEENKNQLEQDLMVKNIDEQQRRLGAYAQETGNLRAEQLGRESINIGNRGAEASAQISAIMGLGGLGLSKVQQERMDKLYKQALSKM